MRWMGTITALPCRARSVQAGLIISLIAACLTAFASARAAGHELTGERHDRDCALCLVAERTEDREIALDNGAPDTDDRPQDDGVYLAILSSNSLYLTQPSGASTPSILAGNRTGKRRAVSLSAPRAPPVSL